jgi:hypothetical protein
MCEGCRAQFSSAPSAKIPAASFPLPAFSCLPQPWLITNSSLVPRSLAIGAAEVTGQDFDYAETKLAAPDLGALSSKLVGEVDQVVVVVGLVSWLPAVAGHGEVPTWGWWADFDAAAAVAGARVAKRPRLSRGAKIEVVSVSHGLAGSRKKWAGR